MTLPIDGVVEFLVYDFKTRKFIHKVHVLCKKSVQCLKYS